MTARAQKEPGEKAGPVRPRRAPVRQAAPIALLRLQRGAGNAAVASLLDVQRADCPAPAPAPEGKTPAADPKFAALKGDIGAKAKTAKAHPPAAAEVKKAQDAAVAPPEDKEAQAKAAQAGKMAEAKPGGFDKAAFIAAVNAAIAKQAPQNLDEADKFATSGKADQIKSDVMGKVSQGKDSSAKDVTDKTKEAPDTSKAVEKPVTPMPPKPAPPVLGAPDPKKAIPDKAPAEQTDLRAGPCENNAKMAGAGVTEDQLARSNEPEFTGALDQKKQAEEHAATAPAQVRAAETQQLAGAQSAAQASGAETVAGMTGAHAGTGQRGEQARNATKTKDEQDRARIAGEIKGIFDRTKTDTEAILASIDPGVDERFAAGEAEAKSAFTREHQTRMRKYKDERYGGAGGALRWGYDLFAGLPSEANQIFQEAKKVYEAKMQAVISSIADFVGAKLAEAKARIATGKAQVQAHVDSQGPALRKLAGEAAKEFTDQFTELESSVDEKQKSLVDDLAAKYAEARNAVDEEIKKLQDENKGWVAQAAEAVGGAIETIKKLKDMLLGVLARAAGAIELIIKDPIGFLGNLISAVKGGVMAFGANIVTHLKNGLKAWLLGNLASAGIEIPETFDIRGILKMVLSILGLTWANVRTRILKFIPEPVMQRLEQGFEIVKILVTEGLPGLWKYVVEKIGDLKEMVLGQIKDFVIERIIKAGIVWLISMLNPAAAFIKACQAIYNIVMFFVEKAAAIKEFVDSVLDSIESIARGGTGGVVGLIENALAKALPMVIGMLASLLGLGGISDKIKSILEKIQAPVNKVIDSVVGTVVKAGKKLFAKVKKKAKAIFDWVAQKIRPKSIAKPFAMASGEPHTLTAQASDSGLKVMIASAFAGEVRAVMSTLKGQAGKLTGSEKTRALSAIGEIETQLGLIAGAEAKWKSGKAKAEKAVKERVQRRVKDGRIKTKAEAEALSKQLLAEKEQKLYQPIEQLLAKQIVALRKLKSMKQFVDTPGKRRLPPGYDVRTRLYVLGSGWKAASTNWRNAEKTKLVNNVTAILAGGYTPAARAKLVKLDKLHQLPENALARFDAKKFKASEVAATAYEVDHSVPLAEHWKSDGHKISDDQRRAHCVDQNKWRLITKSVNASLQAGGHKFGQQRDLDPGFTSSLADGGVPNAKRIDGRPLLDDKDKPLT
ncbi:phage tail protein [Longispora albida]|uniref:phage tail protein n=1 Tax=Longispora albida TaxID=203523 RepID=UPI00039E3DDF|nr:hypothetical protein [Longispora albida]